MAAAEADSEAQAHPLGAVGMARTSRHHLIAFRSCLIPGHVRSQPTMDKPKREAILDLAKYVNERIRVKFTGGREGQLPCTPPR